jgi:hypothetical protein
MVVGAWKIRLSHSPRRQGSGKLVQPERRLLFGKSEAAIRQELKVQDRRRAASPWKISAAPFGAWANAVTDAAATRRRNQRPRLFTAEVI